MQTRANIVEWYHLIKRFCVHLYRRIKADRLTTNAGGLAYTTVLALVPLITVIFFLLSAFPMFAEVQGIIKKLLFDNLVPTANETIALYIEQFINNSQRMTMIGICGLIVTSILLINNIDKILNLIWHTKRKRSVFYNLAIYWTILTMGPILAGVSIAISSYLFSLKIINDTVVTSMFIRWAPFLFSIIGFWFLYNIVPTEPIPVKESLIGALLAAALFELGKNAFAFYVVSFPTYRLIYGVLSALPILLVWIYVSWCIVLFGAEFAATLVDIKTSKTNSSQEL